MLHGELLFKVLSVSLKNKHIQTDKCDIKRFPPVDINFKHPQTSGINYQLLHVKIYYNTKDYFSQVHQPNQMSTEGSTQIRSDDLNKKLQQKKYLCDSHRDCFSFLCLCCITIQANRSINSNQCDTVSQYVECFDLHLKGVSTVNVCTTIT